MSLTRLKSIDHTSFDVLSVDVFDTILLRDISLQRRRFAQVAKILTKALHSRGHEVDEAILLSLRHRIHALAFQAVSMERPAGDATLARMSDIQVKLLGLPRPMNSLFIAAELEVECQHLSPNLQLIQYMNSIRRTGKRVVAVSDMYLSGLDIELLMSRIIGYIPVDRTYASCDFDLTKHYGKLFQKVASEERVSVDRIVHAGDNEHADLFSARRAGCQAVQLRRPSRMQILRKFAALRDVPLLLSGV